MVALIAVAPLYLRPSSPIECALAPATWTADGTREQTRRVRWHTEARGGRCLLRFDESPFPSDVESLDVESYSRKPD